MAKLPAASPCLLARVWCSRAAKDPVMVDIVDFNKSGTGVPTGFENFLFAIYRIGGRCVGEKIRLIHIEAIINVSLSLLVDF